MVEAATGTLSTTTPRGDHRKTAGDEPEDIRASLAGAAPPARPPPQGSHAREVTGSRWTRTEERRSSCRSQTQAVHGDDSSLVARWRPSGQGRISHTPPATEVLDLAGLPGLRGLVADVEVGILTGR